eukprot:Nk52_evm1s1157 gene=Nk52_evmTU1s1157
MRSSIQICVLLFIATSGIALAAPADTGRAIHREFNCEPGSPELQKRIQAISNGDKTVVYNGISLLCGVRFPDSPNSVVQDSKDADAGYFTSSPRLARASADAKTWKVMVDPLYVQRLKVNVAVWNGFDKGMLSSPMQFWNRTTDTYHDIVTEDTKLVHESNFWK